MKRRLTRTHALAGAAIAAGILAGAAGAATETAQYGTKPDVRVLTVTGVARNAATVNSIVGPNGQATRVRVQFGLTRRYTRTSAVTVVGRRLAAKRVSIRLRGLRAGRTYHFRVIATSRAGTTRSADRIFRTLR